MRIVIQNCMEIFYTSDRRKIFLKMFKKIELQGPHSILETFWELFMKTGPKDIYYLWRSWNSIFMHSVLHPQLYTKCIISTKDRINSKKESHKQGCIVYLPLREWEVRPYPSLWSWNPRTFHLLLCRWEASDPLSCFIFQVALFKPYPRDDFSSSPKDAFITARAFFRIRINASKDFSLSSML